MTKDLVYMNTQMQKITGGHLEWSFYCFYNNDTFKFERFRVSKSYNDTKVTTTQTYDAEETMHIYNTLRENPSLEFVWGHSHNTMGVKASHRDLLTMEEHNLRLALIINNNNTVNVIERVGGETIETITIYGDDTTSF